MLGAGQQFRYGRDALDIRAADNEVMRPPCPLAALIVGGAVFQALFLVLLLYKLALYFFLLGSQLRKLFSYMMNTSWLID